MIALTNEQRDLVAIAAQSGEPLRFVDETTQQVYSISFPPRRTSSGLPFWLMIHFNHLSCTR